MAFGVILLAYTRYIDQKDFMMLAVMVFSAYFGAKIPKAEN